MAKFFMFMPFFGTNSIPTNAQPSSCNELGPFPSDNVRQCEASGGPQHLRGPVAIPFISRDASNDSIARLFRACFRVAPSAGLSCY